MLEEIPFESTPKKSKKEKKKEETNLIKVCGGALYTLVLFSLLISRLRRQ